MKNKAFFYLLVLLLIVSISFLIFGCDDNENKDYKINFNMNDGSDDIVASITNLESLPEEPTREGYEFIDWYVDEDCATEFNINTIELDEDITVYAKWQVKEYTIMYNSNGGSTIPAETYEYGEQITPPTPPTKQNFDFAGWYSDSYLEQEYEFNTMPADDMALYAEWQIKEYTIDFEENGGSEVSPITLDYGSAISMPNSPTKSGYDFAGWFIDSECAERFTSATMPDEDKTLYAKWEIKEVTISFEENGGSEVSAITKEYNTDITEPEEPTYSGYNFGGWYEDNESFETEFVFDKMPPNDITLYAKWIPKTYTISFETNGGSSVDPIEEEFFKDVSAPKNPTKEGHDFEGWYEDSDFNEPYEFTHMPNYNTTAYAKWSKNKYTITFDTDCEETIKMTAYYNIPVYAPITPVKEGNSFDGWYYDSEFNNSVEFPINMPGEDTIIYAKWALNEYTITFDTNGGSEIQSIEACYGDDITQPDDPTRTNYEFVGWHDVESLDREYTFPSEMPSENINLYAEWSLLDFYINYDLDGGSYSTSEENPSSYNEEDGDIELLPIEKVDYTFAGWFDNQAGEGEPITVIESGSSGDIDLYAKFWDSSEATIGLQYDYVSVSNKNKYKVSKGSIGTADTVVIPSLYNGKPVTRIEENGFKEEINTNYISSVTLPNSITIIGRYAFNNCINLNSITIPSSVTAISDMAFNRCSSLSSLSFDEESQLTSIDKQAFYECTSLTEIILPENLETIGEEAFRGCSAITNIEFHSALILIDDYAFRDCSSLETVTVNRSITDGNITSANEGIFYNSNNLTHIYVPSDSLNDYQDAENWSAYDNKMYTIV